MRQLFTWGKEKKQNLSTSWGSGVSDIYIVVIIQTIKIELFMILLWERMG